MVLGIFRLGSEPPVCLRRLKVFASVRVLAWVLILCGASGPSLGATIYVARRGWHVDVGLMVARPDTRRSCPNSAVLPRWFSPARGMSGWRMAPWAKAQGGCQPASYRWPSYRFGMELCPAATMLFCGMPG
jgi:hypothetical protein